MEDDLGESADKWERHFKYDHATVIIEKVQYLVMRGRE